MVTEGLFDFTCSAVKQRLHATHNLMELLNAKHPGIPPTLRDDRMKEEVSLFPRCKEVPRQNICPLPDFPMLLQTCHTGFRYFDKM